MLPAVYTEREVSTGLDGLIDRHVQTRHVGVLIGFSSRIGAISGRSVVLGGLMVGQGAPIRVESMLKTPLLDPEGCLAELEELAEAGCELVRSAYTSLE